MSQTNGGKEWHDKENTAETGNSICKDLEGRESLLPETKT